MAGTDPPDAPGESNLQTPGFLREQPRLSDSDREAIRQALGLVIRDMRVSGAIVLDYREDHWSRREGSSAEQVAQLAADLQEWEMEELWRVGRQTNWPECPDHPATHPLDADVNEIEVAVWRCPRTRRVICPIGQLGSPDS